MNILGGDLVGCWLGLHLHIEHIIMAEGRADSTVHQWLQRAEVVHHSFLFLPFRSDKQGSKLLKLGTKNIKNTNQKMSFSTWINYFHFVCFETESHLELIT